MIAWKVRVTSVDHNGACGRDPHPNDDLIGQVGYVIGMETVRFAGPSPDSGPPSDDEEVRRFVEMEPSHSAYEEVETVLTVIFPDNRKFQMMTWEVETDSMEVR